MSLACLELAACLVVYAAFALLQAVAKGQPLALRARALGPRGPALVRLGAIAALFVPYWLLAGPLAGTEAILLVATALALAASAFVLLAASVPQLAWGLALAAPGLAAVLVLGAGGLP